MLFHLKWIRVILWRWWMCDILLAAALSVYGIEKLDFNKLCALRLWGERAAVCGLVAVHVVYKFYNS